MSKTGRPPSLDGACAVAFGLTLRKILNMGGYSTILRMSPEALQLSLREIRRAAKKQKESK
jgi:hypothetical protein